MPAPLEVFLHAVTSGHNVLTPEMYAYYDGDKMLEQLRKYDPDAKFTEVQISPDSPDKGVRLDFDASKLPKSKGGMAGFDLNPANLHEHVKNKGAVYNDDIYGSVTNSANFYKDQDKAWTKYAAIAVSMLAPMAGAALAGAGIGGTAGLTAAATGSGLGGAATIQPWAAQLLAKAPSFAQQISNGNTNSLLNSLLSYGAGQFGVPKELITLAQITKNYIDRRQ